MAGPDPKKTDKHILLQLNKQTELLYMRTRQNDYIRELYIYIYIYSIPPSAGLLKRAEPKLLVLAREPDNKYDANAIAV